MLHSFLILLLSAVWGLSVPDTAFGQTMVVSERSNPGDIRFCQQAAKYFLHNARYIEDTALRSQVAATHLHDLLAQIDTPRARAPYLQLLDDSAANGARFRSKRFLAVADIIGFSVGAKPAPLLLWDTEELKMIPANMMGKDIILVTGSSNPLTVERVKAVAAVARRQEQAIHVIWQGLAPGASTIDENPRLLAGLAALTGGTFIDLDDLKRSCTVAM